jgi:hypothetical protein
MGPLIKLFHPFLKKRIKLVYFQLKMSQPPISANLAAAENKIAAVTTDLRRAEMRIMELQLELNNFCSDTGRTSSLLSHCRNRELVLPDLSNTLPSNQEENPDVFPTWPTPTPIDNGVHCKAFRGFAKLLSRAKIVRVFFFFLKFVF